MGRETVGTAGSGRDGIDAMAVELTTVADDAVVLHDGLSVERHQGLALVDEVVDRHGVDVAGDHFHHEGAGVTGGRQDGELVAGSGHSDRDGRSGLSVPE